MLLQLHGILLSSVDPETAVTAHASNAAVLDTRNQLVGKSIFIYGRRILSRLSMLLLEETLIKIQGKLKLAIFVF